jgi:hypothetical protein
MTIDIRAGKNLLEINKVYGKYIVLTNKINDDLFVKRVVHLLTYHADVFAAYYSSSVYENDTEKMLIINNFEEKIKKYNIFAVETEPSDEKHDWVFHDVKELHGDFAVGEECNISYYLGWVYMFQKVGNFEDKVIISINKDYKRLIDITNRDDKYYVMLSCEYTGNFIEAIKNNLYEYGDVFAAYIKTIDDSLPYPVKENKIYNFKEIVNTLDIRVIERNSSESCAAFYGDFVYIFYTPVKYGSFAGIHEI